jgi:subtilisin family serine protease
MLTDSGFLSQDGKIEGTAVLLEEIGAAICPALSPDDIQKIESEGAIVLSNETIELIDSITYEDFGEDPNDTFWHLAHVNASSPHSRGLTGRGTLIGILDTGIDLSHTEFSEKQIFFRAFGANGDELSDIPPRDYGKHGTHVSALCAGKRAGVAPDAQLAVAAVLTQRNSKGQMCGTTAQVLRGMNWLIQGGSNLPRPVDIINASLGSRGLHDHYYDRLRDALEIDGIVTIAAIGNNGDAGENNHGSPGNYDTVIGVGAIDSKDKVAGFSDWGTITSRKDGTRIVKPDIVAPGVKVVSAIPGGKYSAASGTSMASPLVAGALALILQKRNGQAWNPALRVQELLMAIKPGSGKPNHPEHFRRGYGSLDLGEI